MISIINESLFKRAIGAGLAATGAHLTYVGYEMANQQGEGDLAEKFKESLEKDAEAVRLYRSGNTEQAQQAQEEAIRVRKELMGTERKPGQGRRFLAGLGQMVGGATLGSAGAVYALRKKLPMRKVR